jgi:Icc-related predicted phosphoesterase
MKIQIVSDLHLEFAENRAWTNKNPIIPCGDVLLLAGDIIMDKHRKKIDSFFEKIEKQFKLIISINGNHEFYSGTCDYAYPQYFKQISCNRYKINNGILTYGNIRFIASTLWSHIPSDQKSMYYEIMNDYRNIQKKSWGDGVPITIEDTNRYHKLSVEFIESELNKPFQGKTVLLTHHLPYPGIAKDRIEPAIPCFYGSDLSRLMENYNIALWVFGHIHSSLDGSKGNTRLISNPLGYMSENQKNSFKRDLVIEI